MTVGEALDQCKTLEQFDTLFNQLNWGRSAFGRHRASHNEKKGTIFLNDFIARLNAVKFKGYFAYTNDIELDLAGKLITNLCDKDEEIATEDPNAGLLARIIAKVISIFTYFVRLFDNFRFNRRAILDDMEGQIALYKKTRQQTRAAQNISKMSMDEIISCIDIQCDTGELPSLDSNATVADMLKMAEKGLRNVTKQVEISSIVNQNKELVVFLKAKVTADFGKEDMETAFEKLRGDPQKFEWFARFVVCVSGQTKDALTAFFYSIEWPSPDLKKQVLPSLFNGESTRNMIEGAPSWLKPYMPKPPPYERKRNS
ncbi:MAG TPA: hypothetical protein VLF61_02870 [Rhabdochlamydiaceae bacterium]|nr:hypothetical protein [Rhabdochlamydiaceae bacterium]